MYLDCPLASCQASSDWLHLTHNIYMQGKLVSRKSGEVRKARVQKPHQERNNSWLSVPARGLKLFPPNAQITFA